MKTLAGPPPGRLSRGEEAHVELADPAAGTPAQGLFTEEQAGVIDDEEMAAIMAHSSDPLHQILALQMRQTAALTQKLSAQTPKDAITAVLGNEQGSSGSNGVKGCIAREAFVKAMDDVVGTGRLIAANAAADMGLSSSQVGSGLMRQYVEKRIALADHRLLTYMAQFMACAWQMSHDKGDEFAMGLMARGLMMVEQISLDQGRWQFAWLLSAFPEPDLQTISMNRKRLSIKPYARLASAPWVAGNIAYLKDIDFLETRLKGSKAPDKAEDPPAGPKEEKPRKPWKPKKRGQQSGKDGDTDSTAV